MIERNIYRSIKKHLNAKEITVLIGPRQVGKTTLMQKLNKELKTSGKRTLFINLDFQPHSDFLSSQKTLLSRLELEFGKEHGFVFIDEIQRKENAGLFLKGIYDQDLPYKFIISGSGSLELKENIQESLAGRKRLFEIMPVNFTEFVNYKTDYAYTERLLKYCENEKEALQHYLSEYMNFGGYPRIVTELKQNEKRLLMDEIFRSYVEKDIVYLLKVDRPDAFINLVKLLSAHIGQLINYSTLTSQLNLAVQTLKKYLWYLEKTFIIRTITPYFRNYKKEITKSPMIYFNDLGLSNFSLGRFGDIKNLYQQGFLFQNFVFNILYETMTAYGGRLHFWRTTDKSEVDLIVDYANGIIPVEIKFSQLKQKTVKRSLRSFIAKYHPEKAWVINLNLHDSIQINQTKVVFLPYYFLLDKAFVNYER